ncbi:MAG: DUF4432 family protein [Actinobacteria bacterium]|uniref:Unannotated protein n=1 Tax=freshwater metagenome TaxID=449393 RepID=A0A6J7HD27_9ZZZZ|nr:DUF4432 family protein [Actinomycetota bacterium]MSX24291.1 DUF4432 family protein [Actinomycetota bacterium]MSY46148.1 DUF4432 family protein [Actinomycetota bacterium]MSY56650.1 DUF4432 family protein [Actinomycetota bacterium]MTB00425.1 DUF4432 family protein [Actinomycetota bacterium]
MIISSASLDVTVTPEKGCDILAIVHKESGIDLLFKSPWELPVPHAESADWLARYPGGWQILISSNTIEGSELYGESSLAAWEIRDFSETFLVATLNLKSAPLSLTRRIEVIDGHILISESVENLSTIPQEISWLIHPAFGSPLLEAGSRIKTGATTLILEPGRTPYSTEQAVTVIKDMKSNVAAIDLSRIPDTPREFFATLGDFDESYAVLINDRLDIGVALSWDSEIFPYAWFWQDLNAVQESPWFGQAYVTAIEPATHKTQSGENQNIPGQSRLTTTITFSLFNNVQNEEIVKETLLEAKLLQDQLSGIKG